MKTSTCLLLLGFARACLAADPGFLRGMGWSPWHATYGWNRPAEVVARDDAILRDLHVNALRSWGPVSRKGADTYFSRGFYLVPQVGRGKPPRMVLKDGKPGHPAFVTPEALADIREHAAELARELKGHPGIAAYNLGNEYSWVGQNKNKQFQSQGFDAATLDAFRATLRKRFGTIARWREQTGARDASFAEIIPGTGTGKSLAYWEWWRFQREAFGRFLAAGHAAAREVDPQTPVTYALLCGGRWDAATEDAALGFLELQGDNLYYHWGKDWGTYALRLARRIGPGRPILVTESGINTWTFKEPDVAARLMRQMLWLLALHPEVQGVFPFVYCDEWWHGPDPKALDVAGDAWGIVTADRQPKATYAPLRETYAQFDRLHEFMSSRRSPVELLVSDQVMDRWRGVHGPSVSAVSRLLYRRGVSFRLISLLRPEDLAATACRRLLLLDSTLPDEPDGTSPAREALAEFCAAGGKIMYLSDMPWQGLYLPPGRSHGIEAEVRPTPADVWQILGPFLGPRSISLRSGGTEIFWRKLTGAGRALLLLVVPGSKPVEGIVEVTGIPAARLVSADGAELEIRDGIRGLRNLNTYALIEIGAP